MKQLTVTIKHINLKQYKLGLWNSIGYLTAVVPPSIIDPILDSHIRFPNRNYNFAYLVYPIALLVFIFTIIIVKDNNKKYWLFLANTPLLIASAISLFIFKPEFPHGNIVYVSTVWIIITAINIWTKTIEVDCCFLRNNEHPLETRISYIQNSISIHKAITLGIAGSYLGIVITAVKESHSFVGNIVSSDHDKFIMYIYNSILISIYSIHILFGPLLQSLNNVFKFNESFKTITKDK